ncbi:hypothetical protein L4D09_28530 [Photobacterium makurazakiensis]|uniref:hypothetical protein n=1 Tax=Photobacterium makurazakiensis TaxID=2910234 RepID=UPI003D0BF929
MIALLHAAPKLKRLGRPTEATEKPSTIAELDVTQTARYRQPNNLIGIIKTAT